MKTKKANHLLPLYFTLTFIIMYYIIPVIIGLLYPFFDYKLGEAHKYRREWSSVMRCIAVFVGINHASAVSFYPLALSVRIIPNSHNSLLYDHKRCLPAWYQISMSSV